MATFAVLKRLLPLSALILLPAAYQDVTFQDGLTFQSVSTGASHSCGVTTEGTAYCWGERSLLGNGLSTNSSVPVAVSLGLTFQSVSVGHQHSCGVTTEGTAYCWGSNFVGQLGNNPILEIGPRGAPPPSLEPAAVAGGLTFQSVSAGFTHSCAVTTEGMAYCWGLNNVGQLGNGTLNSSLLPVAVSGGLTFQSVSAGTQHSCGVTTAGAAYCWGPNRNGQLGNGTTAVVQRPSVMARMPPPEPVAVTGGLIFESVSASADFSCGVTTAGTAYCWGSNGAGQLGDGTVTYQGCVDSISAQIQAGTLANNEVQVRLDSCMANLNGVSNVPVAVSGGLTFQSVSAGNTHACGVTTTGTAYCWGDDTLGQLGDGSGVPVSNLPVAVSGGLTFQSVSAGRSHSCGVTTEGAAYCWGLNTTGQLGDGSNTNRDVPVPVDPQ